MNKVSQETAVTSKTYEPPRVEVIGNVHDLLAGTATQGTADAACETTEPGTFKSGGC